MSGQERTAAWLARIAMHPRGKEYTLSRAREDSNVASVHRNASYGKCTLTRNGISIYAVYSMRKGARTA